MDGRMVSGSCFKVLKILKRTSCLYHVLLVGSVMGFFFPILSLLSRLSANDGQYLNKLVELVGFDELLDYLSHFPSWHVGEGIAFPYDLYARWSAYGLISICSLCLFRKKIEPFLDKFESYLIGNKKIHILMLFAVFVYQSKIFAGWWFHGIAGWDFSKWESKINAGAEKPNGFSPTYLKSAINWENFSLLTSTQKTPYTISGNALIAFTEDNRTIPINLGLLEIVFPDRFMESPQTFLELINYKIPMIRDYQSLYPEHTPFARIDYSDFHGSKIAKVEYWDLNLTSDGSVHEISSARINQVFSR